MPLTPNSLPPKMCTEKLNRKSCTGLSGKKLLLQEIINKKPKKPKHYRKYLRTKFSTFAMAVIYARLSLVTWGCAQSLLRTPLPCHKRQILPRPWSLVSLDKVETKTVCILIPVSLRVGSPFSHIQREGVW